MRANMGFADRIIRLVLAAIFAKLSGSKVALKEIALATLRTVS